MADRMKEIILNAADAIGAGRTVETPKGTANLDGEWRWLSVYPGLSEAVGVEITPDTDASVLRSCGKARSKDRSCLGSSEASYRALWRNCRANFDRPNLRL